MPNDMYRVSAIAVPEESGITQYYAATHLADAYAIPLPNGASGSPEQLARFIVAQQASWISLLIHIRDCIVASFGLKTAKQLTAPGVAGNDSRIGLFKIYSTSDHAIILGEDDQHLDFRLSVLCTQTTTAQRRLVLSTVVHCHNRLGRLYIVLIAPFHRLIVQSMLRRAARKGWPAQAA